MLKHLLTLFVMWILLNGCSVQEIQPAVSLDTSASWVMLPVVNHSNSPEAGERVEAVVASLLRSRGVGRLDSYPLPESSGGLPELDERRRYDKALNWARGKSYQYGVTGSVQEWRYKAGLDGEPAVGVTLQIIDPETGKVLWSGTGARNGWGRDSVSATAQRVIQGLLDGMGLKAP